MASPAQISISQLNRRIGLPDSPIIIDICTDEDFSLDPRLIPSSFRFPFSNIENLVPFLIDKQVVVVCHKGKKLGQGTAALLRHHGISAEYLKGGITSWCDADLSLIPVSSLPSFDSSRGSLWVTKQRPKIDRIACPWLIRRFVDRNAKFLFVESSEVLDVADKFEATPFDVSGAYWNHKDDKCTFDLMLKDFNLETEALLKLAEIIRGADTNNLNLTPQSSGLLAASLGLSRMYRDDNDQLEAGLLLYDAFYRWCRDANSELHDSHQSATGDIK